MKNLATLVFVFIALLYVHSASAQVYTGVVAGVSAEDSDVESGFPELQRDVGYRVSVGNAVSEKFAFEIAYVDLGEYEVETLSGEPDPSEDQDTLSLVGGELAFIGKLPIRRRFAVFARAGMFFWEGERRIVPSAAGSEVLAVNSDGSDFSAGLGFEYRFLSNMGSTIEVTRYATDDVSHMLMGAGFYFTF